MRFGLAKYEYYILAILGLRKLHGLYLGRLGSFGLSLSGFVTGFCISGSGCGSSGFLSGLSGVSCRSCGLLTGFCLRCGSGCRCRCGLAAIMMHFLKNLFGILIGNEDVLYGFSVNCESVGSH